MTGLSLVPLTRTATDVQKQTQGLTVNSSANHDRCIFRPIRCTSKFVCRELLLPYNKKSNSSLLNSSSKVVNFGCRHLCPQKCYHSESMQSLSVTREGINCSDCTVSDNMQRLYCIPNDRTVQEQFGNS